MHWLSLGQNTRREFPGTRSNKRQKNGHTSGSATSLYYTFLFISQNNASKMASVRYGSINFYHIYQHHKCEHLCVEGQRPTAELFGPATHVRPQNITLWSVPIIKPEAHGSAGHNFWLTFWNQKNYRILLRMRCVTCIQTSREPLRVLNLRWQWLLLYLRPFHTATYVSTGRVTTCRYTRWKSVQRRQQLMRSHSKTCRFKPSSQNAPNDWSALWSLQY